MPKTSKKQKMTLDNLAILIQQEFLASKKEMHFEFAVVKNELAEVKTDVKYLKTAVSKLKKKVGKNSKKYQI